MRRIRIAAASLMVAAGLIGAVAAPASAASPTTKPAERLCKAQGGINFGTVPEGYFCLAPLNSLSDPQLRAAESLCQGAFSGVFVFFQNNHSLPIGDIWACETGSITG